MTEDQIDKIQQLVTFDPGSDAYTASRSVFELQGASYPMFIPQYHAPPVPRLEYFKVTIPDEVLIYPNPASNYIRVNVDLIEGQENSFNLYNSNGQKVLVQKLIYKDMLVDIKSQANGAYSWEIVKDGRKVESGKLIKQ
jgi:hypothetical protein